MFSAALAISHYLTANYPGSSFAFIAGRGNNGGDAVLCALLLSRLNIPVKLYFHGDPNKASLDCKHWLDIYQQECGETVAVEEIASSDIIVDGLLGTGVNRPLSGSFLTLVKALNQMDNYKIAIDTPSGLICDEWEQNSEIFKAAETLCLGVYKWAFCNPLNSQYTGKIKVLDIGLDKRFNPTKIIGQLITKDFLKNSIPPRALHGDKLNSGSVLLVGGCKGMFGSLSFASKAAFSTGAGLVEIMSEEEQRQLFQQNNPEARFTAMASINQVDFHRYTAVLIGPGLGSSKKAIEVLKRVLTAKPKKLIIDADAINLIASEKLFDLIPENAILTPHEREFKRLCGDFSKQSNRLFEQMNFCKERSLFLLYKGVHSCITTPSGDIFVNSSGNPALAKGGSGDVLAGMLLGLLCTNSNLLMSLTQATYLHGSIADTFVSNHSELSLSPELMLKAIPQQLKLLSC